jgi:integrase
VATLNKLVAAVVEMGGHQCWGDMVLLLATTGMRISEVSGLVVGDVDLKAGLIFVRQQKYPGRGGLIVKPTKGRRNRVVPIIGQGRETLERLTAGGRPDAPLLVGPRGGTITTATLRDATGWDKLVRASVSRVSSGTASGTRRLPGWLTVASHCTCSSGWPVTRIRR